MRQVVADRLFREAIWQIKSENSQGDLHMKRMDRSAAGASSWLKSLQYFALLFLLALLALPASSQTLPGRHPGYLHALTDLRTARWLLYHQPGDPKVYGGEDIAIQEIDKAIGEIKHASIDDGKDVNDHPNVDVHEHGSRLLRAIETLKKAQHDIDGEEENPEVRGLRKRASEHIFHATKAAESAHAEWLKDQGR
jgi:hypothetical protein